MEKKIERIKAMARRADRLRKLYESAAQRRPVTAPGVYCYTKEGWQS